MTHNSWLRGFIVMIFGPKYSSCDKLSIEPLCVMFCPCFVHVTVIIAKFTIFRIRKWLITHDCVGLSSWFLDQNIRRVISFRLSHYVSCFVHVTVIIAKFTIFRIRKWLITHDCVGLSSWFLDQNIRRVISFRLSHYVSCFVHVNVIMIDFTLI